MIIHLEREFLKCHNCKFSSEFECPTGKVVSFKFPFITVVGRSVANGNASKIVTTARPLGG